MTNPNPNPNPNPSPSPSPNPNPNPDQVWWRGLVGSEAGYIASACLGLFHAGAVCAFLWAWRCGAIPLAKVVLPHAPFAAAFLWHCTLLRGVAV